ncbi:MAG: ATP-binding cassette domain-containing protein, partial [Butyrivibrio sp.]|nr:ATP-binding cassette domain-containing protein [Butyrivibrio sp.]
MKIEHLSAGYRGKAVVPEVSLDIKKGEIISFIGPNGAGKSTLLKTLYRELAPVSGAVFIDG